MRKIVFALALLGLAGSPARTACGGAREPAAAGDVLTGIAAAAFVTHAVAPQPVGCSSPAPGLPPVAYFEMSPLAGDCQSAPVVVCQQRVCVQPVPALGTYLRYGFRPHLFGRYFVERNRRS